MSFAMAAVVLTACGTNQEVEALETKMEKLVEENTLATEKIAQLEQQIETLQQQLATGQNTGNEKITIELLQPDDQLLSYQVIEKTIEKGKLEDEIKQALTVASSEVPVQSVTDNGDGTVTINFDKASVSGPNMTSSAQVSVFLDQLKYVMYENFPQVTSYYVQADGKPTGFGETIVFEDAIPNKELAEDEMYLEIKE